MCIRDRPTTVPITSSVNTANLLKERRTTRGLDIVDQRKIEASSEGYRTTSDHYRSVLQDADYAEESKKSIPLSKIRIPQMSPPIMNTSKSVTPQPSMNKPHIEKRTHMKRGRPPVIDLPFEQRIKNIIKSLKKEPMSDGREFLASKFERLPDEDREPQYYTCLLYTSG